MSESPFGSSPAPAPAIDESPTPTPDADDEPAPVQQYSPPSPDQTGPSAKRPGVGVAAGSAAAATILLVLIALALYLVALRRRKRRSDKGNPAAGGITSSLQQHRPSANEVYSPSPGRSPATALLLEPRQPQNQKHSVVELEFAPANVYTPIMSAAAAVPRQPNKQHSVAEVTPLPTASSSWVASSAAPLASTTTSTESSSFKGQKPEQHLQHDDGVLAGAGGSGEILFRGALAYEELAAATNGFSDSNLLGRGGFGDVYAGTVGGGVAVAVKRLRAGSQQGDREFHAELQIINRVHHRNLVSLVGYCIADGTQRLLVYEFVPNLTLHHHLHGDAVLDWPTRWKIAVGAAKGLAYLHEDCHPRIIHRDIKSANILLDDDFNPKVSDFGMAKFIPRGDTHVATRIVGTIGYLAPEYATSGKLTEKSDVFSYGVVLLEIITGMNVAISSDLDSDDTLAAWARPLLTQALELHDFDELVDPLLESFDAVQMERLVRCAAAAVSASPRRRPRLSQIVRHLEDDASAEEIDACGVHSFVGSGSVYGGSSVQSHPVRYDEIRASRREGRVKKLHQS